LQIPALNKEPPDGAILADWTVVDGMVRRFAIALAVWMETGAASDADAVCKSADSLTAGWTEAVRSALHPKRSLWPQRGNLAPSQSEPENESQTQISEAGVCFATLCELALMGLIVDSGRRRQGLTVWVTPANALLAAN
jgi:hypothetical protein